MAVTDDQVEALRAYLMGDFDRHKELYHQLDKDAARTAYTALLSATFCEAVEQKFAKQTDTTQEVIDFVSEVRVGHLRNPDEIDPGIAERLIRAVYMNESVQDISPPVKTRTQMILLRPLVARQELDDAGLDDLLRRGRSLANEWIS